MVSYYHLCEPDHIGAQTSYQAPSSSSSSSSSSASVVESKRFLSFDGSGSAYISADVWPSLSSGQALLQRGESYYRVYVFEMEAATAHRLLRFNIIAEVKHSNTQYEYKFVQPELLNWWTRDSPDVLLECAHSYSSNASAVEHVTPAFVNSDRSPDLQCHYSVSLQWQDRIPSFTTLRFRSRRPAGQALTHPADAAGLAEKLWHQRWQTVPDFTLVLPWCLVSRPAVFLSAFVKPVFGEPLVVAERLLTFIHWHRVIGVDHFYVFDRYGAMLAAAERVAAGQRALYANRSEGWQFFSLSDYVNSGIVSYIPSPCQHPDPSQSICSRYQDHMPTGESCLFLGRPHARWMLQQDIDEYLVLFPPMPRPPDRPQEEPRGYTPYTQQQIIAAAQAAPSSGMYYPRLCSNSLYCPSPLRDFLDLMSHYGQIMYRTWNVRLGKEALAQSTLQRVEQERQKGDSSAPDVASLVSVRHWLLDQFLYREPSWQEMHEKYLCQPQQIIEWSVHEARLAPNTLNSYLMPDRGIYASHFKDAWQTDIPDGMLRDAAFATVIDTVPAPPLQPLTCRDAHCTADSVSIAWE